MPRRVLSKIDVPKPPGGLILWASMNRRRIHEPLFESIGNSQHSYEQRGNFDRLSAFPLSEQGLRAVVQACFGQYEYRVTTEFKLLSVTILVHQVEYITDSLN